MPAKTPIQGKPGSKPVVPTRVVMLGTLLLLAAVAASGVMVLKHFWRIDLPGCGAGSACDQAAASRWGSVLGLPTSFLGLAYFTGLLIAWTGSHGALSTASKWLARFGALASVFFLVVIAIEGLTCPYCLAAHACNLVFLALVEFATRGTRPVSAKPVMIGAAVGLLALTAMGVVEYKAKGEAQAKAERELAESARQIADRSTPKPPITPPPTAAATPPTTPVPTTPTQAAPPPASAAANPAAPTPPSIGFSGRYAWGPESAAVRVVMYTDYQCPDCKLLEGQLAPFLSNPNVAVIIKSFPFCTQCNPRVPNLHANACWAARAAQAAGMMQGREGFWKMHHWLFSQGGSFTDASLPVALRELGFDPQQFTAIMQSQETLNRVKADIDEAWDRGIQRTPMIFINGVELKGWTAPNALSRTLQTVLASNLEPDTFANDPMPSALDTYMSDWTDGPLKTIPAEVTRRALGPNTAPVTVVVFGDYMEPGTREADGLLRLYAAAADSKIRYSFAHFPVNKDCNPITQVTKFQSCNASRAAEAAEVLLGEGGFWKAHDWIMLNGGAVTDSTLPGLAAALGVEVSALSGAMQTPAAQAAIEKHARAAAQLGIQGIPLIFINGRQVPRFKLDNENLLPRMIEAAAKQ